MANIVGESENENNHTPAESLLSGAPERPYSAIVLGLRRPFFGTQPQELGTLGPFIHDMNQKILYGHTARLCQRNESRFNVGI
jgi:hypothetical protein